MNRQDAHPVATDQRTGRLRLLIQGAVQGVGFRPFVYRLAKEMHLTGSVQNGQEGVIVEAEGAVETLLRFEVRLNNENPAASSIESCSSDLLLPRGYERFDIMSTNPAGNARTLVLPDLATCPDCLADILDPDNRRYRYPFTNCTNCGPRYSIIEATPYDRCQTSMKKFCMCKRCLDEYEDPGDRRFHAQPNACPDCGPHLVLRDRDGALIAEHDGALRRAARCIGAGDIVALQGIGGYQLLVDASREDAVCRLRHRKHRPWKPLALLVKNLAIAHDWCHVSPSEEKLMSSAACPIVLLRRRLGGNPEIRIAASVAPGNPWLGVMLPCSPLHHLLVRELCVPVVCTSGNRSDEPICIDPAEAFDRLDGIADVFLSHDRPIIRAVDDSVVRVFDKHEQLLRRSRGYAPIPAASAGGDSTILAVGGHQKNTVCLARKQHLFASQHIGDLTTPEAVEGFKRAVTDMTHLMDAEPDVVVCDLHPDYTSTRYAEGWSKPILRVQHHHAHVVSCMADNGCDEEVLGICWDGSGYGPDDTIWGGEFLRATAGAFERVAHLRQFPLPGGEKSIEEPRRSALGLLYEHFGSKLWSMTSLDLARQFSPSEWRALRSMLEQQTCCPMTSSCGRLFDAVSSLIDLRQTQSCQGQAAMELEFASTLLASEEPYRFELQRQAEAALRDGPMILDWGEMVDGLMQDIASHCSARKMAARFHHTLAEMAVQVAHWVGLNTVALTGGCFQNELLTRLCVEKLEVDGFTVLLHHQVPANDGGIAVGQACIARQMLKEAADVPGNSGKN